MPTLRPSSQPGVGTGLHDLTTLRPVHVAAYIEHLQARLSAPTVKLHLADVRAGCSTGSFRATGITEYLRNGGKL